jgi:hypothetical protein
MDGRVGFVLERDIYIYYKYSLRCEKRWECGETAVGSSQVMNSGAAGRRSKVGLESSA